MATLSSKGGWQTAAAVLADEFILRAVTIVYAYEIVARLCIKSVKTECYTTGVGWFDGPAVRSIVEVVLVSAAI